VSFGNITVCSEIALNFNRFYVTRKEQCHGKCSLRCSQNFVVGTAGMNIWTCKSKSKSKSRGPEGEYNYSTTPSPISAIDGDGWSRPRPGRLTSGRETWYQFYGRLDGALGRRGRVRNISPPPAFVPRTVEAVANCYTIYAISTHICTCTSL
jgi:hypothetical protein